MAGRTRASLVSRRRIGTALGLAALPLCLLAAPLAGQSAAAVPAESGNQVEFASDLPAAEIRDLQTIAGEEGISLRAAVERYGWGQKFSDAVAAIRQAYPASFSSSSMNTRGKAGGVVRFAGDVPADVETFLSDVDAPVQVVGNAGVPETDMQASVRAAHNAAFKSADGLSVTTSGDEQTGEVTMLVSGGSEARSREVADRIRPVAVRALREKGLDNAVRTSSQAGRRPVEETIRGGAILTWPAGGLACTSGWPVSSTSGPNDGLITAAHCANDLDYTDRDVLTYQRKLPTNRGDIQFMSSSESVGHSFYYAVGEYRDIDGPLGTPSNDQYLCFFGRKTGNHCDNVRDTYVCVDEYCNLVSMDDHETDGGDSGGPWYYGSRPYGVHRGYYTSWLQERALFTPIYNTIGDLSVQIKMG